MGIIRTTAYPSRYAVSAYYEQKAHDTMKQGLERKGKLYAVFRIAGPPWSAVQAQRKIAQTLGKSMGVKPVYVRNEHGDIYDRGWYVVDGWSVSGGYSVQTDLFTLESMPQMLQALQTLASHGYAPDGEMTIRFVPERYDASLVFNAYTILEARRELIELALGFKGEAQLIVGMDLEFSFPLEVFSVPVIEACACLLYKVSAMAAATRKARMKPCDMSNPKYPMRSWLLRLGFIGEQFERPRQTLLEKLDGNTAFFNEAGKRRATDKRRLQKAMKLA